MRSIIDYRYNQLSKQGKQASKHERAREGVPYGEHAREMKDNKQTDADEWLPSQVSWTTPRLIQVEFLAPPRDCSRGVERAMRSQEAI